MAEQRSSSSPRRRLTPDERRRQILDAARTLFAERPFTTVSTADVADAAGVARSLVHHYFGGIRELFVAVASDGVQGLDEVPVAGTETPLEQRLAHNLRLGLDLIDSHRETWQAVIGQAAAFGDPELGALLTATNEESIRVTLASNSDVVRDTPRTRLALRCFQALIVEAVRSWLAGEATRAEVERLILAAQRNLLLEVIPALEGA